MCGVYLFERSNLACNFQRKSASELEVAKDSDNRLLLFATLEGNLVAIDKTSGEIKWKIKDSMEIYQRKKGVLIYYIKLQSQ